MSTIDDLLERLPDGHWVTFYKLYTGRWVASIVADNNAEDVAAESIDSAPALAFERALDRLAGTGDQAPLWSGDL